MEDRLLLAIRELPRDELEVVAFRAALRARLAHKEVETGRFFLAVLSGFLLGALVSASGFLLGAGLS